MSIINHFFTFILFSIEDKIKNSPPGKDFPCRNCSHNNRRRRYTDKYQAGSRIYRVRNQSPNLGTRLRRWNNRFRYIRCLGSRTRTCSLRRSTCHHSCRAHCPQNPVHSHQYWSRSTCQSNREDRCISASILQ